jgi:hypothetical protein
MIHAVWCKYSPLQSPHFLCHSSHSRPTAVSRFLHDIQQGSSPKGRSLDLGLGSAHVEDGCCRKLKSFGGTSSTECKCMKDWFEEEK